MKKNDDLLLPKSGGEFYCSKNVTTFWWQSNHLSKPFRYSTLYLSFTLVTLLMGFNFRPIGLESPSSVAESCNEFIFRSNDQHVNLSLPKFDPALGTLRSVEIMTECMIMADVTEKEVKGSNYALVLSVDLSAQLPNQAAKVHQSSSRFNKSIRDEAIQKNGFNESFKDAKQSTEIITSGLDAFTGSGNLEIPLSVAGLINFKDEVSSISSNLKAKICIKYNYE